MAKLEEELENLLPHWRKSWKLKTTLEGELEKLWPH